MRQGGPQLPHRADVSARLSHHRARASHAAVEPDQSIITQPVPLLADREGVEDIPKASLEEGMGDWGWETFPEWLDYAETLHTACDFAALIAHGAVRTYVMGERGADHQEETTPGDLQAMHAVVRQAVEAGAIGFASNRADGHQDMSGNPVPGTYAKDDEVVAIAKAVNAAGGGMFECVSGFLMDNSLTIALKERELYEQISTAGGPNMPIVFNIHPFTEEWNNDTLAWLTNCHAKGMPLYGCTSVKAIATLASMESNVNPFMAASPTYLELSQLGRCGRRDTRIDTRLCLHAVFCRSPTPDLR